MLTKLTQAALSVVLTPVSVVADIVMMPSTAIDGKHPFSHTKALVDNAKRKTMVGRGQVMNQPTSPNWPEIYGYPPSTANPCEMVAISRHGLHLLCELAKAEIASGEAYHNFNAAIEEANTALHSVAHAETNEAWQPIETAPKDGTPVDLWHNGQRLCDFYWGENGRPVWCRKEGYPVRLRILIGQPTHWMHRPSPPVSTKSESAMVPPCQHCGAKVGDACLRLIADINCEPPCGAIPGDIG